MKNKSKEGFIRIGQEASVVNAVYAHMQGLTAIDSEHGYAETKVSVADSMQCDESV